jgi:hypothetical protein
VSLFLLLVLPTFYCLPYFLPLLFLLYYFPFLEQLTLRYICVHTFLVVVVPASSQRLSPHASNLKPLRIICILRTTTGRTLSTDILHSTLYVPASICNFSVLFVWISIIVIPRYWYSFFLKEKILTERQEHGLGCGRTTMRDCRYKV